MDRDLDLEEQYDRIYRYCYFKLHCRETAEDITQEVFLRFLGSGSYRSIGKALRYLYTIARNLCIDEIRRRKRQSDDGRGIEAAEGIEVSCPGKVVGSAVRERSMEERLVTVVAVREALMQLEEEERELILLRYVNEVPVETIGKIYGVSRFAIYRRTKEAIKLLKEKLEEDFA